MPLEYKKQSLFDAPKHSIIIHSCNAQGVWGAGIAAEFKKRYPYSYSGYYEQCKEDYNVLGTGDLSWNDTREDHWVGWIIVSSGYGKSLDSQDSINVNTTLALFNLCKNIYSYHPKSQTTITVYSNKFNSGLFGIPWEGTEFILKSVLSHFPRIKWVVCDPDLKEQT